MSKILITGANGNLGTLTIKHLINSRGVSPDNIVALVRNIGKAEELKKLGVEIRVGSYDDKESLIESFKAIDRILIISSPNMDNVARLKQQFNLVMAAYEANVKHIYLVSLANPYNRTFMLEDVDLATEHMVISTGIPFTILRNAVYLDEITNDIRMAVETGKLLSVTKNKGFNYVLRDDLALVNATVLTEEKHNNKIYELVNSELHTYEEVSKILSGLTGSKIVYDEVEKEVAIEQITQFVDEEYANIYVDRFQLEISKGSFSDTSEIIKEIIGDRKTEFADAISSIYKSIK